MIDKRSFTILVHTITTEMEIKQLQERVAHCLKELQKVEPKVIVGFVMSDVECGAAEVFLCQKCYSKGVRREISPGGMFELVCVDCGSREIVSKK